MNQNKRLGVLLVIPRYKIYGNSNKYVMPLGTLYVSAFLKQADVANVVTLNLNHVEGEEKDILARYIKEYDIDFFGIGGLSGEYSDLNRMATYAKNIKPSVKVVLGGGIMTSDPETTMKAMPDVDFGIIGEGEYTMVELLKSFSQEMQIGDVDGLIFRQGSELVRTQRRAEIKDLDALPFPDYEGFNYDRYLIENPDMSDPAKKYTQVSVVGGRSCRYNCTFCFHPSGTTYRQRSLDSIFKEIDYLVTHYKITYIALREELFATDNQRVAEFCERMKKYDVDWSIQLRIDNINNELVRLLKPTRCRYIFVGVESASDKVLKSMHKGITLKQIEEALALLYESGITFRTGIIMGDTAETYETARFSLDWFYSVKKNYGLYVDMIIAFPGSIVYKRAIKSGIIPDPVRFLQDGCPIVNFSSMSQQEFKNVMDEVQRINGIQYNFKNYRAEHLL